MRDSRPKSAYLVELGVKWLVRRASEPIFATFTFAENVTSLAEAKARWRPVADWLRRHQVKAVGAWQRQARGAWHIHVVCSRRVNILELREFAVERGWGTFINLRPISVHDRGTEQFNKDVDKTASYVARYVKRDMNGADWGDSLTIYVGRGARVGNVRFAWAGGLSGVYRAGVAFYWELFHERPDTWQPATMELVMNLGLECVLGTMGYEEISNHPRFWGASLPPPPEGCPF